jgi:non-heme chloroperoxidase
MNRHGQTLHASRRALLVKGLFCGLGGLGAAVWPLQGRSAVRASVSPDHWFQTSDGVRLHYTSNGVSQPGRPTLVMVPGWTMPAWIWQAQIDHFASTHRVIAFDPRGQGRSAVPATGYTYARRALDIQELLAAAKAHDVVLAGWSLGVLETLQYLHDSQAAGVATPVRAVVLVDNSVGEGEPPKASHSNFFSRLRKQRADTVRGFVRGMFKREHAPAWLDELTQAALRTPLKPSIALLSQGTPREFWRDALYALNRPVLYAYTPRLAEQGRLAAARQPTIETMLFEDSGHALFVDDAPAFNRLLEDFMARLPDASVPVR